MENLKPSYDSEQILLASGYVPSTQRGGSQYRLKASEVSVSTRPGQY